MVRGPLSDNEARVWHSAGDAHQLFDRLMHILWKEQPLEKYSNTQSVGTANPRPAVTGQQPEAWYCILLTN